VSDDNQQRYDNILQRIAHRKPFKSQAESKPKSPYDLILDSLNAYDTFDVLTHAKYTHIITHGPKVIRRKTWSGVVIWYRDKGYHGYKLLSLFGIWLHQHETDIQLTIGIRKLPYRASVYNPEGYFATIRKDFKLFYDDSGQPPTADDDILFHTPHNTKERLTYRQTLSEIINQWKSSIDER